MAIPKATKEQKIYFLGYAANRLLKTSFEWLPQDDRDSYLNKRIDLTGALLNNLFRNYFNKLVKDMEKQVIKEMKLRPNTADNDLQYRAKQAGEFLKEGNKVKLSVHFKGREEEHMFETGKAMLEKFLNKI